MSNYLIWMQYILFKNITVMTLKKNDRISGNISENIIILQYMSMEKFIFSFHYLTAIL